MQPIFTNDAVVLGLLLAVLALIFYTSHIKDGFWSNFYKFIPALLLAYFLPALLNWPLKLISPEWFDNGLIGYLADQGLTLPKGLSFEEVKEFLAENNVAEDEYSSFVGKSKLYHVASRYLLPASLVLFCLSIDIKGIMRLGWRAIVMFLTGTVGIILGGPIALLVVSTFFPDLIGVEPEQLWRGLSTIAGSWIGGGANQTAMKEIFEVNDNLFGTMIVVDVVVANIWMGFLLFGAGRSNKIDNTLKADNSAITHLKEKISDYRKSVEQMPTVTTLLILFAVAFGGVALAHWGADILAPLFDRLNEATKVQIGIDELGNPKMSPGWYVEKGLSSLLSGFFWLIVICTTLGLALSFTKAKKLEGVGASRWATIFIWILVATIGMKMNLGEVFKNLGLFAVGLIWMSIHVILLMIVAKLIKAPFFYVAVGSQANVGGAASAPVVASAFNPSLAPVGVLMAVLGYAIGTYGALVCAWLMQAAAAA